jgi:hypothetical protein
VVRVEVRAAARDAPADPPAAAVSPFSLHFAPYDAQYASHAAPPSPSAKRRRVDAAGADPRTPDRGGGGGGSGGGGADRDVFGQMGAAVREAMEADSAAGHLEMRFDARTQCRTAVFLTSRYASLVHAAPRPAALALYAAHAVPLPGPEGDVLAAAVHDLLHRLDADSEQFLRIAAGDGPAARAALVRSRTRKTFDACGRIVKVRRRAAVRAVQPCSCPPALLLGFAACAAVRLCGCAAVRLCGPAGAVER